MQSAICVSDSLFVPSRCTGKERDAESGLDYFGARYYASSMGRWMSPDWADKPEAVPYSKLDDPQSLNLYEYVGNNPLSRADADGHQEDVDPDESPEMREVRREENALRPVESTAPIKLAPGADGEPLNLMKMIAPGEYQREQSESKGRATAAQSRERRSQQ